MCGPEREVAHWEDRAGEAVVVEEAVVEIGGEVEACVEVGDGGGGENGFEIGAVVVDAGG